MLDNPRDRELYWCKHKDWGKWLCQWGELGPAYTLFIDEIPVMCAGVVILKPGLGEAWMVLSSLFYRYKKECFMVVRDRLEIIIHGQNLKRVQALIETDFPKAEHWLYHLGFLREKEEIGPDGKPILIFGRGC